MSDAFRCDRCGELHPDNPALRLLKADHDGMVVPAWELCGACENVFREEFGEADSEALSAQ
jgi:hypothetical protein